MCQHTWDELMKYDALNKLNKRWRKTLKPFHPCQCPTERSWWLWDSCPLCSGGRHHHWQKGGRAGKTNGKTSYAFIPQVITVDSTCLCCHHRYLLQGHHLSQTAGEQKKTLFVRVMAAHASFSGCCPVCYLVRVDHIGTAVTGISHPIIVSVFLVWVGDSRAVVKDILQAWDHKHLSTLISASCVLVWTGQ